MGPLMRCVNHSYFDPFKSHMYMYFHRNRWVRIEITCGDSLWGFSLGLLCCFGLGSIHHSSAKGNWQLLQGLESTNAWQIDGNYVRSSCAISAGDITEGILFGEHRLIDDQLLYLCIYIFPVVSFYLLWSPCSPLLPYTCDRVVVCVPSTYH